MPKTKAPVRRTEVLDREIDEFFKKTPQQVADDLAAAGINPAPTVEAVTRLMKEKLSGSRR